ncbi:tetratricopeptide repeat protein [Epibacterium sp. SM1969]|uniref:protein O-GlcNAc transferase n=1 Tax=Tritonibacter aquimaris TaxID=2663379 RepID=A0A844ASM7_9RHOB|nr:glycosyltransferase family 41 protein [Tritonibacter aquimaris]MQY44103.1 tetratricopeptide repeat protein [Tritonibacter aquimaris]
MTVATFINKAKRLEKDEKLEEAAKAYSDILSRYPQNVKAREALQTLRNRLKNIDEPPADMVKKIRADLQSGNLTRAASTCAAQLNSYRKSHFLWQTLGECHLLRDSLNEAATCLNKALELNSQDADTYVLLGNVFAKLDQRSNAIALLRKALQLDAKHLRGLNDLGNRLLADGQTGEALDYLQRAAEVAPENAIVLYNYAAALRETGQIATAKQMYQRAIEQQPDLKPAHYNLGQLYVLDGENTSAVQCFENANKIGQACDRSLSAKLHAQAHLNDWSWIEEYQKNKRQIGLQGTSCQPFQLLSMEDNPDLLRVRTQANATDTFTPHPAPTRTPPTKRPQRLRIGYFSSDFHSHATMHLMGGLFAAHDKHRFEVFAYSYGPNIADDSRAQVRNHVDHFIEASAMSDDALIQRAHRDKLDIAIDLKGYTGGNRCGLFSAQLAPLQVSYLGYPGTMGSQVFDYLIGDWQVCPAGSERYFDEHLIRMPHSYQVNDNKRPISEHAISRRENGLPEEGFVFCCFNNSYKITPAEFDIWMRLLTQVPGSVLWLLETSSASMANLRREAQARGVDATRLVFAPRIDQPQHLARHTLADLFLDTFVVNAHTTASDALWAGLPMLTLAGKQFAARVGASLLSSVGLPELISTTEAEYETLALELAQNPAMLERFRSRLQQNRPVAPLFDTRGFTRDLEAGFDLIHARWRHGLLPDHIDITKTADPAQRSASAA